MVYFTYLGAFNFCNCHLKLPVLINSWKRRIILCYSSSKCMLAWYSRAEYISRLPQSSVLVPFSPSDGGVISHWARSSVRLTGRLWQGRNPELLCRQIPRSESFSKRAGGRWGKGASRMRDLGSFCRPTSSATPPLPFFFFFYQFLKNAQNWKKQVSVTMQ